MGVERKSLEQKREERRESFVSHSIQEHMRRYEEAGLERKDAMNAVAKHRGVGKREIYQYMLDK